MYKVFNTKTSKVETVSEIDLSVHVHNSGAPFDADAVASLKEAGAIKAEKPAKETK